MNITNNYNMDEPDDKGAARPGTGGGTGRELGIDLGDMGDIASVPTPIVLGRVALLVVIAMVIKK